MIDDKSFNKAIQLIKESRSVLIITHTRPDGDACGCLAAMRDVLTGLGKRVKMLVPSVVPQWYVFLFDEKVSVLGKDVAVEELIDGRFGKFDLIIIVDTSSYTQLEKLEKYIKSKCLSAGRSPILVIDHHVTSDGFGGVELIDSTAGATGLILLDLFRYAGWPVTQKIADSLFVAIATDTGWFQFNNTNSRIYRSCAELSDAGAKPTEIYDKLYQNFSYPRFKLMLAMLNKLELHLDNRFATMSILQQDFARTGAAYEDTENFINECHRISSVKVSALFVELKDGRIRCSLRSRGDIDVSEIAAKYGGGGHKMAAGTYLSGPLETAKELILREVTERLPRATSGRTE